MTDIFRFSFMIILLTIAIAAYFLLIGALFTNRVAKTQRVLSAMAGRAFGVGLVNFLFFGAIAIVLYSLAGEARAFVRIMLFLPALLITFSLTVMLSFGLIGLANLLGERIFPEANAWKRTVFGTMISTFACALPFIGWFLLFPSLALAGIGAFILGIFQRERPA